jgi:tetratricopeptide (TPR) repeat protein
MKSALLRSLVLAVAVGTAAYAGTFNCFLGSCAVRIDIAVPEPPVAYIGKKTAKIDATSQFPDMTADQLRTLISQALAPDIAATDSSPEAFFRVNVITFDRPVTKQYALSERFNVKVGQRPVYNKDGTPQKILGQPVMEDVYEERVLPVQYWEANGMVSMTVDVKSATGATLDAFTPTANYNHKIKLSVGNESTPEAGHVPDDHEMLREMASQVAAQIRHRYSWSQRRDVVNLAVDNELKAGNAIAKTGKWDEALKQWESVKMKKNESDRIYNMAVANEMLAYSTYGSTHDMQAAYPLFTKAMELYSQALQADPGEKYIQQAQTRIMRAKASMDTALKQYQAQRFEAEKLDNEITARRDKEKAIERLIADGAKGDLPPAETPGEVKFRTLAHARMNAISGDPSDDQINALLGTAKDLYGVDADAGRKIVYFEIGRKRQHDKGIALYRENLTEFAKNKRIEADERSVLRDIKQQYNLSDAETGDLELHAGITPPGANSPKTPNPVPKPVAQKPPRSNP